VILRTAGITFSYGAAPVIEEIDITLEPGITAIIGPNAAGKSTLLQCLCGLLQPTGSVLLDDRPLASYSRMQRTRTISYLPQSLATRAVLTVFEVVLLGRLHRLGWHVAPEDAAHVDRLLKELDLSDISGRYINELSGGQAQLVAIAQALAREPKILLMDEPTASLDLKHQFDIFSRIREITLSRGISTALTIHDINMAARIADRVYVLTRGRIACEGPPEKVLTEALISDVFGVAAAITFDPDGRPLVTPRGRL
jgi:iron complex transport system ATP-binding protein